MPARLLDEAVDHGESEPRPGTEGLGRVERLEYAAERDWRDPGAGVRDCDHDVLPGCDVVVPGCVHLVEDDVVELDREPPSGRHRIARVEHEVEQTVLELMRIDERGPDVGLARVDPDLDVFAEGALEERPESLDEPRYVGRVRL